jgi:hypothetical protein
LVATLRVSLAEAPRRAQGDPTRGLSRDPTFLAGAHAAFAAALDQAATDLVVDTERTSPEQLAVELANRLLERTEPDGYAPCRPDRSEGSAPDARSPPRSPG